MKIFEMKSSKAVIIIRLRLCAELEFALAFFRVHDGNLKRMARTLPSLDPLPRSKEGRTPMRACAVNRKAGHVERGSQKPNERLSGWLSKIRMRLIVFAARFGWYGWRGRWQKFSFGLSPLNREVVTPRCETPTPF